MSESMTYPEGPPTWTGDLPREEGTTELTPLSAAERRSLPHLRKLRLSHSLAELSVDYEFFSHGLLISHGGFDVDVTAEWMLREGCPGAVFSLDYPFPLFSGMDAGNGDRLNHRLFGCEREVWVKLSPYLNQVSGIDRARKRITQAFLHRVVMLDPQTTDRHPPSGWAAGWELFFRGNSEASPTAPRPLVASVVGVAASDGTYGLKSAPVPCVTVDGPEDGPRTLWNALFGVPRERI